MKTALCVVWGIIVRKRVCAGYRAEYEENTRRLNELAVDSGAIEKIAREKYLMKKPNEDIYVFQEDIEE